MKVIATEKCAEQPHSTMDNKNKHINISLANTERLE